MPVCNYTTCPSRYPSRNGLAFNNCTMVLVSDEFTTSYTWVSIFTSPSPAVAGQVSWLAYFVSTMQVCVCVWCVWGGGTV